MFRKAKDENDKGGSGAPRDKRPIKKKPTIEYESVEEDDEVVNDGAQDSMLMDGSAPDKDILYGGLTDEEQTPRDDNGTFRRLITPEEDDGRYADNDKKKRRKQEPAEDLLDDSMVKEIEDAAEEAIDFSRTHQQAYDTDSPQAEQNRFLRQVGRELEEDAYMAKQSKQFQQVSNYEDRPWPPIPQGSIISTQKSVEDDERSPKGDKNSMFKPNMNRNFMQKIASKGQQSPRANQQTAKSPRPRGSPMKKPKASPGYGYDQGALLFGPGMETVVKKKRRVPSSQNRNLLKTQNLPKRAAFGQKNSEPKVSPRAAPATKQDKARVKKVPEATKATAKQDDKSVAEETKYNQTMKDKPFTAVPGKIRMKELSEKSESNQEQEQLPEFHLRLPINDIQADHKQDQEEEEQEETLFDESLDVAAAAESESTPTTPITHRGFSIEQEEDGPFSVILPAESSDNLHEQFDDQRDEEEHGDGYKKRQIRQNIAGDTEAVAGKGDLLEVDFGGSPSKDVSYEDDSQSTSQIQHIPRDADTPLDVTAANFGDTTVALHEQEEKKNTQSKRSLRSSQQRASQAAMSRSNKSRASQQQFSRSNRSGLRNKTPSQQSAASIPQSEGKQSAASAQGEIQPPTNQDVDQSTSRLIEHSAGMEDEHESANDVSEDVSRMSDQKEEDDETESKRGQSVTSHLERTKTIVNQVLQQYTMSPSILRNKSKFDTSQLNDSPYKPQQQDESDGEGSEPEIVQVDLVPELRVQESLRLSATGKKQGQVKMKHRRISDIRADIDEEQKIDLKITMDERKDKMEKYVKDLEMQSADYFKGKELSFDSGAKYIQCIKVPNQQQSMFISVQEVAQATSKQSRLQNPAPASPLQPSPQPTASPNINIGKFGDQHQQRSKLNQQRWLKEQDSFNVVEFAEDSDQIEPATIYLKIADNQDNTNKQGQGQDDKLTLRAIELEPDVKTSNRAKKANGPHVLFSVWTKQNDQFQSLSAPRIELNVFKRPVNKEQPHLKQVLYAGHNDSLFFFCCRFQDEHSEEFTITHLNVLKFGKESISGIESYEIPERGRLQKDLKQSLLLMHQESNKNEDSGIAKEETEKHQVNLPQPTLVNIRSAASSNKHYTYLVMTSLSVSRSRVDFEERVSTSVCFYKLETTGIMGQQPNFEQPGAELFVDTFKESEEKNITQFLFLTNLESHYQSIGRVRQDYSRLISPPILVQISYTELKQQIDQQTIIQSRSAEHRKQQIYYLATDNKSMSFFRCQSHLYPRVQAAITKQKKDDTDKFEIKHLALRFFGSDTLSSALVLFKLQQEREYKKVQQAAGNLSGFYSSGAGQETTMLTVEQEERILAPTQDAYKSLFKAKEESVEESEFSNYDVELRTYRKYYHWYFEKWTRSHHHERLPLKVEKVKFDEQKTSILYIDISYNGDLVRLEGQTGLEEEEQAEELVDIDDNKFSHEHLFKVKNANGLKLKLEGSFINSPFNTRLVGIFSIDGEIQARFTLQKHNFGSLTLIKKETTKHPHYDVEISAGKIMDKSETLDLRSEKKKQSLLLQDVHKLMKMQNESEMVILQGSLTELQQKKAKGRFNDGQQDKSLFMLTVEDNADDVEDSFGINLKKVGLSMEQDMKEILSSGSSEALKNENSMIQDMAVQDNQLILSLLHSETTQDSQVKFLNDSMLQAGARTNESGEDEKSSEVQGSITQTWMVDYPLIAYNSYLADNSQIHLANLAKRNGEKYVIKLNEWQFLCFVNSVYLNKRLFSQIDKNQKGDNTATNSSSKYPQPLDCQILFLARHKAKRKIRLMSIVQDPWSININDEIKSYPTLRTFQTHAEINMPPDKPLHELKSAYFLATDLKKHFKKTEYLDTLKDQYHVDMAIVLQYTDDMWSISLTSPDCVSRVFDPNLRTIAPRHAVRRYMDISHIYCIVKTTTTMQVVKVALGDENEHEKLVTTNIYETHSSNIVLIEPDTEHMRRLFVLEDDQNLVRIDDTNEGKATVLQELSTDLSMHDLEDTIAKVDAKPWTSVTICDRAITFDTQCYSLYGNFKYCLHPEEKNASKDHQQESSASLKLLEERNLPGTLFSMQIWLQNGRTIFRCKPLADSKLIDLIGQSRMTEETELFFTAHQEQYTSGSQLQMIDEVEIENNLILVSTHGRILVFDNQGFYVGMSYNRFESKSKRHLKIIEESNQTKKFGKFLLIKSSHGESPSRFQIFQTDSQGIRKVTKRFDFDEIKDKIKDCAEDSERVKQSLTSGDNELKSEVLEKLIEGEFELKNEGDVYELTEQGELVIIGKIHIKKELADKYHHNSFLDNYQVDDHSEYLLSHRKFFTVYELKYETNIKIKVFFMLLADDARQQPIQSSSNLVTEAGKSSKVENEGKSSSNNPTQKRLERQLTFKGDSANRSTREKDQKKKHRKMEDFRFGVVDNKIILLDTVDELVQFIDFDDEKFLPRSLSKSETECEEDKIYMVSRQIQGFTVREIFQNLATEIKEKEQIKIDEIPKHSTLRRKEGIVMDRQKSKSTDKNGDNSESNTQSLMQLTIGGFVIVYLLEEENRYEVSMLADAGEFSSPIIFSNTGFEYKTKDKLLYSNQSSTLGILYQPKKKYQSQGLYRSFSEIDLQFVIKIKDKILNKHNGMITKADLGDIETRTIVQIFNRETFFSIFAEQTVVYDHVYDTLKILSADYGANEEHDIVIMKILRRLRYVIDRPIPLWLKKPPEKKGPKEKDGIIKIKEEKFNSLSIVKQSLLFKDEKACESIFRIAEIVNLAMDDYISNQKDLILMFKQLPVEQYTTIINKLATNVHTQKIKSARMAKMGDKADLDTFIQTSQVISLHTPALRATVTGSQEREDEQRKNVQISIIPLQWIQRDEGTLDQLYNFFKDYDLQGSILQEAIFDALWRIEQPRIIVWVFMPYLIYFIVCNLYFCECMLAGLNRPVSLFASYCGEEDDDQDCVGQTVEPYLRYTFLVLLLQQIIIEVSQFFMELEEDFWKNHHYNPMAIFTTNHFSQASNWIDLFSLFFNVLVIWLIWMDVDIIKIRIIASIAIVLLWMQLLFWFRLSDHLAQHVDLIQSTIEDIVGFMFVLMVFLMMFAVGFYMLQINRLLPKSQDRTQVAEGDEDLSDRKIYPYQDDFGSLLLEGMFNQYLLILGDFHFTFERNVPDESMSFWINIENKLVMLYFILSTFVTQIVILNMLIAIMSATFSRHESQLHASKTRQRLNVQAEFVFVVEFYMKVYDNFFCCACGRKRKKQKKNNTGMSASESIDQGYLFVIQPSEVVNPAGQDSTVSSAQSSDAPGGDLVTKKFRELDSLITKKVLRQIQDMGQTMRDRFEGIEKNNEERHDSLKTEVFNEIKKNKQKVNEKTTDIHDKIDFKLAELTKTLQAIQKTIKTNDEVYRGELNELKDKQKKYKQQIDLDNKDLMRQIQQSRAWHQSQYDQQGEKLDKIDRKHEEQKKRVTSNFTQITNENMHMNTNLIDLREKQEAVRANQEASMKAMNEIKDKLKKASFR